MVGGNVVQQWLMSLHVLFIPFQYVEIPIMFGNPMQTDNRVRITISAYIKETPFIPNRVPDIVPCHMRSLYQH